jgi:hypothetical protein
MDHPAELAQELAERRRGFRSMMVEPLVSDRKRSA